MWSASSRRVVGSQSGQVGLAVLLIMVVVATVGISVATRSSQDLRSSRQSQEAVRTFSAAEAALEDVLSRGEDYLNETEAGEFSTIENAEVSFTIDRSAELTSEVLEGAVAEFDLSGSVAGNIVRVEWGDDANCAGSNPPASLLVTVVNTAGASPVARYLAYAICDNGDGFTLVSDAGATYARYVEITLENGDTSLRITPIYNDTPLYVAGTNWTPQVQQYTIRSVARNTQGRETKGIEVQRTTDAAPAIFDYALVSGTTIIK